MVISNTDLPSGVCSLQKDLVCAGPFPALHLGCREQTWRGDDAGVSLNLMNAGVSLNPFPEPWKALQAKHYLISAGNTLSGV